MMLSDEDLAKAAGSGDRAAFSALINRHYDRIFTLSFRFCGTRATAEDLTQDICVSLPGKLRGYEGRSKFTTWLYRVILNASHDRRRKLASREKASQGWGDAEENRRASNAEDGERLSWLNRAMQDLKPEFQDTLALTIEKDLTQSEAADVLGVSEGTVAWRMSEIKKQLRQLLKEEVSQ